MSEPQSGRPRLGKTAMTGAERQARYRKRRQEIERLPLEEQYTRRMRGDYKTASGYQLAKEQLTALGHHFEHAGREWRLGVFIDGALMDTYAVVTLAKLTAPERQQRLAAARRDTKQFACDAVTAYMAGLQVTRDELFQYLAKQDAARTPAKTSHRLV